MSRQTRLSALFAVLVVGVGAWGALQVFPSGAATTKPTKFTAPAGTKISPLQPIGANAFASTKPFKTYLVDSAQSDAFCAADTFCQMGPTTTISCNPPNQLGGSCGLEVDSLVQSLGSQPTQGTGVCIFVDNAFVDACPVTGTAVNTNFSSTSALTAINLPVGTHTVTQYYVSFSNADAGPYYSFFYRLYGTG